MGDENDTPTQKPDDGAEARVKAAEARAKELEAQAKKRAAELQKRKAEKLKQQSLEFDTLKTDHEKVAERAEKASKRVAELESKLISQALEQLGEADRKRAEKYREKFGLEDFLSFVDDMFRQQAEGGKPPADGKKPAPPAASPMGPGAKLKPRGRELHAETPAVLRRMSGSLQSSEYARRLLDKDPNDDLKWVVPVERLLSIMHTRPSFGRETPMGETITKLIDAIEKGSDI